MDTAWAIKRFAEQDNPLEILCERESIYKQLPGITPASLRKNFHDYTIDPKTRYLQPIVNHQISQVNHLYNESVESQQIEEKLNPIDSVFESKCNNQKLVFNKFNILLISALRLFNS